MTLPARRILIVEDEPGLVISLTDRLTAEGFDVEVADDGDTGFEKALAGDYDLLILDVMLPGRSGFDLCRDLRQRRFAQPILMLTARGQVIDRVLGLKLGADDYLTKPFDMLELLARIEALLRRVQAAPDTAAGSFTFGDVRVDFRRAEVTRGGEPVELTPLETRLLRYFVEHRNEVLTRDRLLDEVWGYNAAVATRTVDQHVASLRQKLERDPAQPEHILTRYGVGYKFVG